MTTTSGDASKFDLTVSTGGEVFSFHLRRTRLTHMRLWSPVVAPGLCHAENFFTMLLGEPVLSMRRYRQASVATLCWWRDEPALDAFLATERGKSFADGWHIRLRLYRRWGRVSEIADAVVRSRDDVHGPVVGLTLARLKLSETLRFTRYGKPVERQVRDHPGQSFALAAMRPLNTFCTFSMWRDEEDMLGMVYGRREQDGTNHEEAMRERKRRDFHREFTTMRLVPLREVGDRPLPLS